MKNKTKAMFLVISIILISLSLFLLVLSYKKTEKKIYDSYLVISNHAGFDLNNTIISFGQITPGGSSTRKLIIENNYDVPVYVEISAMGDLKEFFQETRQVLQPYTNKTINLVAVADKDAEFGRYDGKIIVVMKRTVF